MMKSTKNTKECKPNPLIGINKKAFLGKITLGSGIKDLDSSHPHFNRHGSNQLDVLFSILLLCIIKKRCLPFVDDLKWSCSQPDDPDFSDITHSAKPIRHNYKILMYFIITHKNFTEQLTAFLWFEPQNTYVEI